MAPPLTYLSSCLNPPGSDRPQADKAPEYVLFRRVDSVAGLTIEHRVKHHGHAGDSFAPLYHFDRELPSYITEVLIRNGQGSDHEDGARFVGYTQNRHWLLNNAGERFRIVNAGGAVLAEFDVPANTCNSLPTAPKVLVTSGVAAAAFGEVS